MVPVLSALLALSRPLREVKQAARPVYLVLPVKWDWPAVLP